MSTDPTHAADVQPSNVTLDAPSMVTSDESPADLRLIGAPVGTRLAIGAALAAVFISALDLTVIASILVRMISDLGVNTADVDRYIWVVNAYLVAYVVAIPLVGRLSDLSGRTVAFIGSLVVFLIGSIWCANANDLSTLIIARAVQGAGGGALLPVTMALIGDVLPRERRTAALGMVGAVDTLGWVLGPIWGALIVGVVAGEEAWRWVFWINVPLSLVAIAAILRSRQVINAHRVTSGLGTEAAGRAGGFKRLDVIGALLLTGFLVTINLALSSGGEVGGAIDGGTRALGASENPLADFVWWLLGGALVAGVAFLIWERRAALPVLPLTMFRSRRFSAAIAANFVVGSALIIAMVNTPLVVALLVDAERASSVSALMLAPFTLAMAVFALGGGILTGRLGERFCAGSGILLIALGYFGLWLGLQGDTFIEMLPGLGVSGAGFGLIIAPIGGSAIDAVTAAHRGIAAGMVMVFRLLGMSLGVSGLTAAGVWRLQMLTRDVEPMARQDGEPTADFLIRQQQYIEEYAVPLSVQVVRETFVWSALLVLLGLIPVWFLRGSGRSTTTVKFLS